MMVCICGAVCMYDEMSNDEIKKKINARVRTKNLARSEQLFCPPGVYFFDLDWVGHMINHITRQISRREALPTDWRF